MKHNDQWYVVSFNGKQESMHGMFSSNTVLLHEHDFNFIARAFWHTHKRVHYIKISDRNYDSFPDYIKQSYENRQEYGKTPE